MRYAYNAEWYDPVSGNKMTFTLLHWPQSSEAELVRRLPLSVPPGIVVMNVRSGTQWCRNADEAVYPAVQVDAKKRKTFLKRTQCEGLGGSGPLRPGSFVTVMARRLQILSPADSVTRDKLSESTATRFDAPQLHINNWLGNLCMLHCKIRTEYMNLKEYSLVNLRNRCGK